MERKVNVDFSSLRSDDFVNDVGYSGRQVATCTSLARSLGKSNRIDSSLKNHFDTRVID